MASVTRFLDPDAALAAAAGGLEFTESRPLGGTWVLDALWSRLGTGRRCAACSRAARRDEAAERVLFALVANRALAPSSKLAASRWVNEDVLVAGLPATSDDACYRAMDWLTEIKDDLERKVFDNLADLLNLEVDLLFFDTTSTYFETEEEDEPVFRDDHGMPLASGNAGNSEDGERDPGGFRTWGKSKDHRNDLPQVRSGLHCRAPRTIARAHPRRRARAVCRSRRPAPDPRRCRTTPSRPAPVSAVPREQPTRPNPELF